MTDSGGTAVAPARPSAVAERRPAAMPDVSRAPAAGPVPLDINILTERWDEIVAAVRRERPLIGTLLEHTVPTAVTASGVVSLQVEETGVFENLASKAKELTVSLAQHIASVSRVQLLPPERASGAGPVRMTAESIKSETLLALRKRDPVLSAAIDELDLDLVS
jgi:hypothetical protein